MVNRIWIVVFIALILVLKEHAVAAGSTPECLLSRYLTSQESDYVKTLQNGDAGTSYMLALQQLRRDDYALTTATWSLLRDSARVSTVRNPDFDTRLFSAMLALSGKLSSTCSNSDVIGSPTLKAKVMLSMAWQIGCRLDYNAPSYQQDIVKVNSLMLYGNYLAVVLKLPAYREHVGYTEKQLRDKLSLVEKTKSEIISGSD